MVVGKPHTLDEFKDKNMTRNDIANEFCKFTNQLFADYIDVKKDTQQPVTDDVNIVDIVPSQPNET